MRLFFFIISILALLNGSCSRIIQGNGVSFDAARYNTLLDKKEFESVVAMVVTCPEGNKFGSGGIIDRHVILTARHMLKCDGYKDVTAIFIKLPDGSMVEGEALALTPDKSKDIALISTEEDLPVSLNFSFRQPLLGEQVHYIAGLTSVRKRGDVFKTIEETFYFGARAIPGDSGSIIVDSYGEVVGVVSAYIEGTEQIAVGVGTCGIKEMIENRNKLITTKKLLKMVIVGSNYASKIVR